MDRVVFKKLQVVDGRYEMVTFVGLENDPGSNLYGQEDLCYDEKSAIDVEKLNARLRPVNELYKKATVTPSKNKAELTNYISLQECRDCHKYFEMKGDLIYWYAHKAMKPPKRCPDCRIKNKEIEESRYKPMVEADLVKGEYYYEKKKHRMIKYDGKINGLHDFHYHDKETDEIFRINLLPGDIQTELMKK